LSKPFNEKEESGIFISRYELAWGKKEKRVRQMGKYEQEMGEVKSTPRKLH